jgi:hypothetical protein
MAKHGTLPEFMYQRQCVTYENAVNVVFENDTPGELQERENGEDREPDPSIEEGGQHDWQDNDPEYDESSDEEVRTDTEEFVQGEVGSSANFLIGATSRFGRAIRVNNRLLS